MGDRSIATEAHVIELEDELARLTAEVERLQALLRSAQGMMAELGVEDAYDLLWSSIGAALAREDGGA